MTHVKSLNVNWTYTLGLIWAGLDEKMDGMTILALVCCPLCPHHKVDMYAEIRIIKTISIDQYDNDVHLSFDTITSKKFTIDMKDSTTYTNGSFI